MLFITDEFPYKIWSRDCVIVQGAGSACIFDVQGACGYICQICTYTPGQFMGVCTCEGWWCMHEYKVHRIYARYHGNRIYCMHTQYSKIKQSVIAHTCTYQLVSGWCSQISSPHSRQSPCQNCCRRTSACPHSVSKDDTHKHTNEHRSTTVRTAHTCSYVHMSTNGWSWYYICMLGMLQYTSQHSAAGTQAVQLGWTLLCNIY